jgi:hypothetical protein
VEQVHQHRLAAPDAAPQVSAADRRGLAEQLAQPARRLGLELALERVEPGRRRLLFRIRAQLARLDERAIPLEQSAQTCRSTWSFLISAIALAGFSPLGQTLAQFMIVWQR